MTDLIQRLRSGDHYTIDVTEAAAALEAANARIAELSKDAERYRWLTKHAYIGECFTHEGTILEVCGTARRVPDGSPKRVSDAIDAAIAASAAKGDNA